MIVPPTAITVSFTELLDAIIECSAVQINFTELVSPQVYELSKKIRIGKLTFTRDNVRAVKVDYFNSLAFYIKMKDGETHSLIPLVPMR